MGLDPSCDFTILAAGFDDIRVDRALHEKSWTFEMRSCLFKQTNEQLADDSTFLLGIGNTFQAGRKFIRGVNYL